MNISHKKKNDVDKTWFFNIDEVGIHLSRSGQGEPVVLDVISGFVTQLVDDGYASREEDAVSVAWSDFYNALGSGEGDYDELPDLLGLPSFSYCRPVLKSYHSLTDSEFSIEIRGWKPPGRQTGYPQESGAILSWGDVQELMRAEHWALRQAVDAFSERRDGQRSSRDNKLGWGDIRQLALDAGANLDNFLTSSVVLTPDMLQLQLRKSETVTNDTVVEVEPGFEDAPTGWVGEFDKWPDARDEYRLPTEGYVTADSC